MVEKAKTVIKLSVVGTDSREESVAQAHHFQLSTVDVVPNSTVSSLISIFLPDAYAHPLRRPGRYGSFHCRLRVPYDSCHLIDDG